MLYVVKYRAANFMRWVAILDKINNEQIIYTNSSKSYWVCLNKWKSHYCLKPTSIYSYSLVLLAEWRNNKNNFYYLWFDKTGARTHDIGRANRQVKSAQSQVGQRSNRPKSNRPQNYNKKKCMLYWKRNAHSWYWLSIILLKEFDLCLLFLISLFYVVY